MGTSYAAICAVAALLFAPAQELGARRFHQRERVAALLRQANEYARPALVWRLRNSGDLETLLRTRRLLAVLDGTPARRLERLLADEQAILPWLYLEGRYDSPEVVKYLGRSRAAGGTDDQPFYPVYRQAARLWIMDQLGAGAGILTVWRELERMQTAEIDWVASNR